MVPKMSNSLVRSIIKEFSTDQDGNGFVTRRGLARLCGVTEGAIRKLLIKIATCSAYQNLSKSLQPLAGQSFEGADLLSDIVSSAVVQHYAFAGSGDVVVA